MHLVATNVGRSLIFLLSTGGPTEPLDTTGRNLRFRKTVVEKQWLKLTLWCMNGQKYGQNQAALTLDMSTTVQVVRVCSVNMSLYTFQLQSFT